MTWYHKTCCAWPNRACGARPNRAFPTDLLLTNVTTSSVGPESRDSGVDTGITNVTGVLDSGPTELVVGRPNRACLTGLQICK